MVGGSGTKEVVQVIEFMCQSSAKGCGDKGRISMDCLPLPANGARFSSSRKFSPTQFRFFKDSVFCTNILSLPIDSDALMAIVGLG